MIPSSLALRWRAPLEVKPSSVSNAELRGTLTPVTFRSVEFRSAMAV